MPINNEQNPGIDPNITTMHKKHYVPMGYGRMELDPHIIDFNCSPESP